MHIGQYPALGSELDRGDHRGPLRQSGEHGFGIDVEVHYPVFRIVRPASYQHGDMEALRSLLVLVLRPCRLVPSVLQGLAEPDVLSWVMERIDGHGHRDVLTPYGPLPPVGDRRDAGTRGRGEPPHAVHQLQDALIPAVVRDPDGTDREPGAHHRQPAFDQFQITDRVVVPQVSRFFVQVPGIRARQQFQTPALPVHRAFQCQLAQLLGAFGIV